MTTKRTIGTILALIPSLAITAVALYFMLDGRPVLEKGEEGRFSYYSLADRVHYLTFIIAPVVLALAGILCMTVRGDHSVLLKIVGGLLGILAFVPVYPVVVALIHKRAQDYSLFLIDVIPFVLGVIGACFLIFGQKSILIKAIGIILYVFALFPILFVLFFGIAMLFELFKDFDLWLFCVTLIIPLLLSAIGFVGFSLLDKDRETEE